MTELSFRRAVRADLPAIIALLSDDALGSGREDPAAPPPIHVISKPSRPSTATRTSTSPWPRRGGSVIGCLQLSFIPGLSRLGMWRGQIESVRIAAAQRGGGIGRRMFEWAIEECRRRGCGLVQLTTDKTRPEALRFYEGLGFQASHEGMKLTLT